MPKPRPQVPPLPLLNGYAAAVSSNQLNQRRQQLATSRSSGAIPCSTTAAVPLAQVNTSMRRYSSATNPTEYLINKINVNSTTNGSLFNHPYPPPSTMPYKGDLKGDCDPSKMREYSSSSLGAQFNNCQLNNSSDACSSASFQNGMKEVPSWLKALRLHKYTQLFQQMSYVEMMGMDDQQLEHRQVTKGARKKILQSIQKLRERVSLLKQLETCIDENGDTRCLIFELRAMMSTPIWMTGKDNQEDLPHHICRILQRLHNRLFDLSGLPPPSKSPVSQSPLIQNVSSELSGLEDEYVVKLIQTYDKVVNHEAFNSTQKQLISQQRRCLRLYAQQQYIQYSNPQFRNFSSTPNQPIANKTPSSNGGGEWTAQPTCRPPASLNSSVLSEHHQHRHSLLHNSNQERPPPPPMLSLGMTRLNANGRFNTNHSRFAGLEATETEMEQHRSRMYAGKVDVPPPSHLQQMSQFWSMERPPPQLAQTMAPAKPPLFSQQPSVNTWPDRTQNGFPPEKSSSTGCWIDQGQKKRVDEQGWTNPKEQGPTQLSYPQLLLSMLSSMPEFRELLEKSIYSKNSKKATVQTAATQTGNESRFQQAAMNAPTATDRPLTAEEKLQFVNEFFLQNSPEKETQGNSSSWWQPPCSETIAKQLASLKLAKHQQEEKSKPIISDTFASAFSAWTPLAVNAQTEPMRELIEPIQKSFPSSSALFHPSLSLSNISSGYSSSTCSETERAFSPGLMVYNFNDCSKCCSKLCDSNILSICPSFDGCAKETKTIPKKCESRDSANGWYQPSSSFNYSTNQKTKVEQQQPAFVYTSPPPALFFSQANQYSHADKDWRQQQQQNSVLEQPMWYEDQSQRLINHSPSSLRQTNNVSTQQQLSSAAHLWSAAQEMRAVH